MPFPAYGWILVALSSGIQVLIRKRVKEKVGSGPTSGVRRVVVVSCMGVEQLASVEGTITARLEPNWKVVLIVAFMDKLWITACIKLVQLNLVYFQGTLERDSRVEFEKGQGLTDHKEEIYPSHWCYVHSCQSTT
jgi:hypothetical protein